MTGKFYFINNQWFVDLYPIHEEHSLWVKLFANENQEVNYYLETLPDSKQIARLGKPDNIVFKTYPQD